ncbi:MAG: hypothetical protein PHO39_10755 [Fermentimonas sp.]|nr:hypothetical protein [Fermentimonas sp.]
MQQCFTFCLLFTNRPPTRKTVLAKNINEAQAKLFFETENWFTPTQLEGVTKPIIGHAVEPQILVREVEP